MADVTIELGGSRLRAFDNADGTYSLAVGNQVYSTIATGELISGTAALQGPNVTAKLVQLWTGQNNAGTVYWGASTVTTEDGTADTTTGVPMKSGETSNYIPVSNLNKIWHVASAADQRLFYVALS